MKTGRKGSRCKGPEVRESGGGRESCQCGQSPLKSVESTRQEVTLDGSLEVVTEELLRLWRANHWRVSRGAFAERVRFMSWDNCFGWRVENARGKKNRKPLY